MKVKKIITKLLLLFFLFVSCNQEHIEITSEKIPEDTVVLYATSWCYWCERSEIFLNKNNIKYIKYDFEDPEDYERLMKTAKRINYKKKIRSVPVFVIGNKIITGFDPIEIIYTLGRNHAIMKTFERNYSLVN